MAGTDLVQRTTEVVAVLDGDDFRERVEPLLPDTVPFRRFAQVAKTAVRANPDLAGAEQRSLFNAIIRCAESGLYPNNEDAALVPYKGKVTFIPMVDGVRKIAAEYGWDIRARVVYAEDGFEFSEEPPVLRHTPVRPGLERGERIAVYAVANHRDGRRRQRVLYADEVAKRRSKAQTTRVWDEFTDAMWMKSAVHAIFDELPRAERDLMTRLEVEPDEAVDLLYGPNGATFTATPANGARAQASTEPQDTADSSGPSRDEPGTGAGSQQAEPAPLDAGSVPGPDDDEEPEPVPAAVKQAEKAGTTVVPNGYHEGRTLREVAETDDGREWLAWAIAHPGRFEEHADFHEQLCTFVEGALPELWQAHTEKAAA